MWTETDKTHSFSLFFLIFFLYTINTFLPMFQNQTVKADWPGTEIDNLVV